MKLAIVTDVHVGVRSDSLVFDKLIEQFFTEVFFPTIKERKINYVVDLGDLFDRRKFINFEVLSNFKRYYIKPLQYYYKQIWLVGNHNIYHKHSNELNNLDLLLSGLRYDSKIISEPETFYFDDVPIFMLPWINKTNYDLCMKAIKDTPAKICFAHLELAGFEMQRGNVAREGMDKSILDKFDIVLSGHYHHRNSDGKIHYLGCTTEQDWSDCDDVKGFHIFDTETRELEFIPNPFTVHKKFIYDDALAKDAITEAMKTNGLFKEKFVKLIVNSKSDMYLYNNFFDFITDDGAYDISVVDNASGVLLNQELITSQDGKPLVQDDALLNEDTFSYLRKQVDESVLPAGIDKTKIVSEISDIYKESLAITSSL